MLIGLHAWAEIGFFWMLLLVSPRVLFILTCNGLTVGPVESFGHFYKMVLTDIYGTYICCKINYCERSLNIRMMENVSS